MKFTLLTILTSGMAMFVAAQETSMCNHAGCGTAQAAPSTTLSRGTMCNYAGCGTAQAVSSTATSSDSGTGCNHAGCGTAQRAFAAPTPTGHIMAVGAVMGFGALGAAGLL